MSSDPALSALLTSPTAVRRILRELGLRPSRALGQNFLIDANILRVLVDALAPEPGDAVLEIGPGLGVVTEALLGRVQSVLAVEKDARLCGYLGRRFGTAGGLTVEHRDALTIDWAGMSRRGVTCLVSNLPYAAGSRILVDMAAAPEPPGRAVVTVQQEVARRLLAVPGTRDYGLLTLFVRARFAVREVKRVSPSCFWPPPRVASTIVALARLASPPLAGAQDAVFRKLARLAFAHRRKQMRGIFTRHAGSTGLDGARLLAVLAECGQDPGARPEQVPVDVWLELAKALTRGS
jgi:16S rRNA (adenine1518-N6/adenine1519-N6)-dimethyltransferase